jgi:hypothetical protein
VLAVPQPGFVGRPLHQPFEPGIFGEPADIGEAVIAPLRDRDGHMLEIA